MEKRILCTDIYERETEKAIKTLKRFREVWLRSAFRSNAELFQFADDDFYFYRFAVDREEKNRILLLDNILYEVLCRYSIDFEIPEDREGAPFDFIINTRTGRVGYSFEDFYSDDDIAEILNDYKISKAYIIRTVRGKENIHVLKRNECYKNENMSVEEVEIQKFFEEYFSVDEYYEFEKYISEYVSKSRNIMGYQSIKVLSAMNLSARKLFEEKLLRDWDYEHSKYQIVDNNNSKIQNILYVRNFEFGNDWTKIKENYVGNALYKAMIGTEDFAESFITSEWLYYSLKGSENFDYTAIVSGYLKSIEQLLFKLVMLNIDNNCVISLKGDKDTKQKAIDNAVVVYEMKWDKNTKTFKKFIAKAGWEKWLKFPYIDFVENQKEYMDSSIGTFEYFLRNNQNIFIEGNLSKVICDMVSCFRTECRNGYFHTHNLHDSSIVDKTRENAILLYAILLGCVNKTKDKKEDLGILVEDRFDSICKEIREIRRYRPDFIFVYEDGTEKKMIYDTINNTPEYTEDGVEHYEYLMFYEVEDFSLETYEKLDTPIKEEWKHLLTRENLPKRIYCVDIKKNIHEVSSDLLQ